VALRAVSGASLSGGIRHSFPWPVARRSRYSGTSKERSAAFGLKRTTLIDFLAWIGSSAGLGNTGEA
jgi:hypothetical protein